MSVGFFVRKKKGIGVFLHDEYEKYENAELREELEYYKNRKLSGRQKHSLILTPKPQKKTTRTN